MPANIAELSYYLEDDSQRFVHLQELSAQRELNASDAKLAQIEECFRSFVIGCALKNFYPDHKVTDTPIEVTFRDSPRALGLLAHTSDSNYYESLSFANHPTTGDGVITADYSQRGASAAEVTETLGSHRSPTSLITKILKPEVYIPLPSLVLAEDLSKQPSVHDVTIESFAPGLIIPNKTVLTVNGIKTTVSEQKELTRLKAWAVVTTPEAEFALPSASLKTLADTSPLSFGEIRQSITENIVRNLGSLASSQQ